MMQTFLPEPSFKYSAAVLDYRRLGQQRREARQILLTLLGESKGWVNHPATKMWRGYEEALCRYGLAICEQWRMRGYNDTLGLFFEDVLYNGIEYQNTLPPWFGWRAFHVSHQSNLVRKNPEHYRRYYPDVPDDLPYIWPV
jgi:hypothetical protein